MPNYDPQLGFRLGLPADQVLESAEALGNIPGHGAERGFRLGLSANQNVVDHVLVRKMVFA
jgi:hypothetical protein